MHCKNIVIHTKNNGAGLNQDSVGQGDDEGDSTRHSRARKKAESRVKCADHNGGAKKTIINTAKCWRPVSHKMKEKSAPSIYTKLEEANNSRHKFRVKEGRNSSGPYWMDQRFELKEGDGDKERSIKDERRGSEN